MPLRSVENKALHLWVPATSLVSEVNTAVEEFSHCYNRHGGTLLRANFFRVRIG
jgi:hypothetical protein